MVGVGNRAAGGKPAERAVDQRWKVGPEVRKAGETLETALRGRSDVVPLTETEWRRCRWCRNRKCRVRRLAEPFPACMNMEMVPVQVPGEHKWSQTLHQLF